MAIIGLSNKQSINIDKLEHISQPNIYGEVNIRFEDGRKMILNKIAAAEFAEAVDKLEEVKQEQVGTFENLVVGSIMMSGDLNMTNNKATINTKNINTEDITAKNLQTDYISAKELAVDEIIEVEKADINNIKSVNIKNSELISTKNLKIDDLLYIDEGGNIHIRNLIVDEDLEVKGNFKYGNGSSPSNPDDPNRPFEPTISSAQMAFNYIGNDDNIYVKTVGMDQRLATGVSNVFLAAYDNTDEGDLLEMKMPLLEDSDFKNLGYERIDLSDVLNVYCIGSRDKMPYMSLWLQPSIDRETREWVYMNLCFGMYNMDDIDGIPDGEDAVFAGAKLYKLKLNRGSYSEERGEGVDIPMLNDVRFDDIEGIVDNKFTLRAKTGIGEFVKCEIFWQPYIDSKNCIYQTLNNSKEHQVGAIVFKLTDISHEENPYSVTILRLNEFRDRNCSAAKSPMPGFESIPVILENDFKKSNPVNDILCIATSETDSPNDSLHVRENSSEGSYWNIKWNDWYFLYDHGIVLNPIFKPNGGFKFRYLKDEDGRVIEPVKYAAKENYKFDVDFEDYYDEREPEDWGQNEWPEEEPPEGPDPDDGREDDNPYDDY